QGHSLSGRYGPERRRPAFAGLERRGAEVRHCPDGPPWPERGGGELLPDGEAGALLVAHASVALGQRQPRRTRTRGLEDGGDQVVDGEDGSHQTLLHQGRGSDHPIGQEKKCARERTLFCPREPGPRESICRAQSTTSRPLW